MSRFVTYISLRGRNRINFPGALEAVGMITGRLSSGGDNSIAGEDVWRYM